MKSQKPELDLGFLYGTAWKEDLTESCVFDALSAGFRAIDTANQRKHYYEEGVGKAIARAYSGLGLCRGELFLQTKFTYARGQDHRKPYDEKSPFKTQVQQSFQSSLQHLQTDYIDSYVLHGPSSSAGLADADWETWGEMESLCHAGKVKYLGISNVNLDQLVELYENAAIKPKFVQNRCFADTHWDKAIREFCLTQGIVYQGFSLLTANAEFLGADFERPEGRNIPQLVFADDAKSGLHPEVAAIVRQTGRNIQQVLFRFAQQIGILPLTGTRSPVHMKANLEIGDFSLSELQLRIFEDIAFLK